MTNESATIIQRLWNYCLVLAVGCRHNQKRADQSLPTQYLSVRNAPRTYTAE